MLNASSAAVRRRFVERLSNPDPIVAPGVFDALSALLAQQAGFEAVFFSGSAMATSHLALADVGLMTLPELTGIVQRAADRVSIPIVVDVDSAFGGAPQAARVMRSFERAGAAAVQVEDQQVVKPSTALLSRPLVSVAEMQDKIRAMLDARESPDMLLSARTDARDPAEALDRCAAYREAGADLVFPEGTTDTATLSELRQRLGPGVPLVYNNHYPEAEATTLPALQALGVNVVLFPVLAVRSSLQGLQQAFASLKADPSLHGGARSPLTSQEVEAVLESADYLGRFA
jgi:2-methylisocitrate lyase-like PEP mutase family enzyme